MSDYDRWGRYYDLIYGRRMDYESQCNHLRSLFEETGVPEGGRILDLGCGTGGHAITLAGMGYRVTGIDDSKPMVEIATEKAGGLPAEFLHQDMTDLDLLGGFDAAICMFGGFGHITEIADVRRALRGISSLLLPGAPFIFEYWNVGGMKPEHTGSEEVERDGLKVIRLARSVFDPTANIVDIRFEFTVRRDGKAVEQFLVRTSIRSYERGEMEGLLADADFDVRATWDGEGLHRRDVLATLLGPVQEKTFRILCIALRR